MFVALGSMPCSSKAHSSRPSDGLESQKDATIDRKTCTPNKYPCFLKSPWPNPLLYSWWYRFDSISLLVPSMWERFLLLFLNGSNRCFLLFFCCFSFVSFFSPFVYWEAAAFEISTFSVFVFLCPPPSISFLFVCGRVSNRDLRLVVLLKF